MERKNSVDAQRFVDFYASKGWKVGNQPMKDWRAAVRTWERDRDATTSISRARSRNTLLNYDEKGRSHASLEEIKLDPSELEPDPPPRTQKGRPKPVPFDNYRQSGERVDLASIAADLTTEF